MNGEKDPVKRSNDQNRRLAIFKWDPKQRKRVWDIVDKPVQEMPIAVVSKGILRLYT